MFLDEGFSDIITADVHSCVSVKSGHAVSEKEETVEKQKQKDTIPVNGVFLLLQLVKDENQCMGQPVATIPLASRRRARV